MKLTIADPAMDSSKQISYIENFVTQEVDALIVTAVDPSTLGNVTNQAKEAGIPISASLWLWTIRIPTWHC